MFKNRKDAGQQLAEALLSFKAENPLVLAIPKGGAEVGFYIAKYLKCDYSVLISRKLSLPSMPETAFGAMAEDKTLLFNPLVRKKLSKKMIDDAIQQESKIISQQIQFFRQGAPLPKLNNRTVILVDDGIATGATILVAVDLCKKRNAKRIIIAAPVSGLRIYKFLQRRVNEIIVLETPINYHAVSQAYEDFPNLTNDDVVTFLNHSKSFTPTS